MDAGRPAEHDDLAAAYAAIVSHALNIVPHAHRIRVVIDGPDGEAVFPVPMGASADALEASVLDILNRQKPGEWLPGKALAAAVDVDRNNGNFNRLMTTLRTRGVVESNHRHGFRMTQKQ